MNADGSGELNLTRPPANDRHPVWSPDGRKIAFVSNALRRQVGSFRLHPSYLWSPAQYR
jgi:Tol biopolymer transport system component